MTRERIFASASFFIPLGMFLAAVCPTIHLGDSGELSTAAATLSIPHVPSYPLLTQFGFALSRLPLGSLAFRTNLASVLGGALACLAVYFLLLRITKNSVAAFALAMAFAGGLTFFKESLAIRAYPLNTAFAALLFLGALHWRETKDRRYLFGLAFAAGAGLANHQILLAAAMFPAVIVLSQWRELRMRDAAISAIFVLAGLSIYLYLPLRAGADPVLNWGDPGTLPRFLDSLLQRQYANKMLSPEIGPKLAMAAVILRSLATEAGLLVFGAALAGIFALARRDRAVLAGLFLVIASNIALRVNYIGPDEFFQVLRYTTASTLAVLVAAGYGLAMLADKLRRPVFLLLLAATAALPVAQNFSAGNLSRHYVAEDFAKAALAFPEEGYAIAAGGDNNIFPLWFFTRVERYREDVAPLPKGGFGVDWIERDIARQISGEMLRPRPEYAAVSFSRFYSTVENLAETGRPVYSLFSSTQDAAEQSVFAAWDRAGRIAPCGLGFRLDGKACDERIWKQLPMSAYVEPSIDHDHHTTTLLDNVTIRLTQHAQAQKESGDAEGALASLRIAAAVMPEDPRPAAQEFALLASLGRVAEAAALIERMKARFPDDPRIRAAYDRFMTDRQGEKGKR